MLLLTAGITFYIYRQVETQRAEVRRAFRRYLAPEVVEDIIASPAKLALGGEARELTLSFATCAILPRFLKGLPQASSPPSLTSL